LKIQSIIFKINLIKEVVMIYEIEAFDEDAGFFSNANDKLSKEFNKIAKKRVNDG